MGGGEEWASGTCGLIAYRPRPRPRLFRSTVKHQLTELEYVLSNWGPLAPARLLHLIFKAKLVVLNGIINFQKSIHYRGVTSLRLE